MTTKWCNELRDFPKTTLLSLKKKFWYLLNIRDHNLGIKNVNKKNSSSLRRGKIELSNDIKIMCWNMRYYVFQIFLKIVKFMKM